MSQLVKNIVKHHHASWIELRGDRLLANLETLRRHSGTSDILAVTKANAYGHGLGEIARIMDGKVSFFGVATLREALELKERHPRTPVFLFGNPFPHEIPAAIGANLVLSVSSYEKAREISDHSGQLGRTTSVHVKVDTGMGRLGIRVKDAAHEIMKMRTLKGLRLDGIYTHLPAAELEDDYRENQVREFTGLLENLDRNGIAFRFRHAQNSAASLSLRTPSLNMLRPGLALYGIYPDTALRKTVNLEPVLAFRARIAMVKKLKRGESSGYGRAFMADRDTTLAILPVGYSHGYPWTAWKHANVLYKGKRCPLAGKISMDYLTVDMGDQTVVEGETVTLIGEDHGSAITAEELAGWAGTIPYEIVTRLNTHIPRIVF
ncbi:MAG: Alanine racemase [Candidatus Omnitrophica bacterium ADurb.Bin277]|nr:MAG: Alanine racemase [Candidatus Omnitrophica bacterium ADurb.Bin277]